MINEPYYFSQVHFGEFWFHLHQPGDDCGIDCQEISEEQWCASVDKISGIKRQIFHEDEKKFKKEKI